MIYFFIAPGFEEAEALVPFDYLCRANKKCVLVSFSDSLTVSGSHGIKVVCDMMSADLDISDAECIVFPGGGDGTKNLDKHPMTDKILEKAVKMNIYIAAICAAPSILGKRGLLEGKNAVCYPGFEKYLNGAKISGNRVVADGKIITAKGAGAAYDFGYTLACLLADKNAADTIKERIY